MIYLNNAATSYPKPDCVLAAHARALSQPPASQFRSGGSSSVFDDARTAIAAVLGVRDAARVFFTSGATEALNCVLRGIDIGGRTIATTQAEHNSVLRPLYNAPEFQGRSPIVLPSDSEGHVLLDKAGQLLTPEVGALVVNHLSNVTGARQDMAALNTLARERGIMLIVDASQSAGCVPIEADKWGAGAVVFTGHKSLMGPQGTGGFYVRDGVNLKPLLYGGTGRDSAKLSYIDEDFEYEAGTQNAPGIAALTAGVRYVLGIGISSIEQTERATTSAIISGLTSIPNVRVYPGGTAQGPVVSFNIDGMKPSDVSYILSGAYSIITRSGLQCAPLIHSALGTERHGVVRVSHSVFTKDEEIEALLAAVREIAGGQV